MTTGQVTEPRGHGLTVRDVVVSYGGVRALDGVSLHVPPGTSLGLIGPNGAGKTTLFNAVAGKTRLTAGEIRFDGKRVDGRGAQQVARLGIRRTFQTVKLFRSLTVRDNVKLGCRGSQSKPPGEQEIDAWLERFGLLRLAGRLPAELTLAEQKKVEVVRAAITRPKLLLLDEMMNGLTEAETQDAVSVVRELQREVGATIVIEHVLSVIHSICSRAVVLDYGQVICEGSPQEVMEDEHVKESYLGAE
jgi:branched-chain amino acid transport system ATP-binding protein